MLSEDDYLQVLRGTLVGNQITAVNNKTLTIATSAGDIINIKDASASATGVSVTSVTADAYRFEDKVIADVRFTRTMMATFTGANRWRVFLDVQLASGTGGWYTLASSSIRLIPERPESDPPLWMSTVVVTRGKSLLALAQRDAGLT